MENQLRARSARYQAETTCSNGALGAAVAMEVPTAVALAFGQVQPSVAADLSRFSVAIDSAAHLRVRRRGGLREAHLPTEQSSPRQEARLPSPDEHPRRASRAEGTSRQGPAQPVGLIWRIRERSAFARLAREGRRSRAGALWCTYILDPTATPPRVAYALSRAVGPAVVRNRLRRRLRALLEATSLPPGLYLIGAQATAARLSADELAFDLNRLAASVRG